MNVLRQKRMRVFFIVSVIGLLFSSCREGAKSPIPKPSLPQEVEAQSLDYLTEEAASAQAVELYSALFGNGLREGEMPQVKDVRRVASSLRLEKAKMSIKVYLRLTSRIIKVMWYSRSISEMSLLFMHVLRDIRSQCTY